MIGHQARKSKAESSPKAETNAAASPAVSTRPPAWVNGLPLQPKLTVNEPGDLYEQEADAVAEQVMRMPAPGSTGKRVQRCACGGTAGPDGECEACKARRLALQRKGDSVGGTEAPPSVHQTLNRPGQPLDDNIRGIMESRFDADFSSVRVHTDSQAAQSAGDVAARAYTVGSDVVFGAGQYAPETDGGKSLLAHELTHVMQQGTIGSIRRQAATESKETEFISQIEDEIDIARAGASQDVNLMLRANATRRMLLLEWRERPPFASQQELDKYLAQIYTLALTELSTLGEYSSSGVELALAAFPKGFPLTWSGRIHVALTLGTDISLIFKEVLEIDKGLAKQGLILSDKIFNEGLPIPFSDFTRLEKGFKLRLGDAHSEKPSGVRDFAREGIRHMQLRWVAAFLFIWELVVNQVASRVADGLIVPNYLDWKDFKDNKQAILRGLPDRARDRLAKTEDDAVQIQTDATKLSDITLMVGMTSSFISLFSLLESWKAVSDRFDFALDMADVLVAKSGSGERIIAAFKWAWHNDYLGDAWGAWVQNLVDNGAEILKEIGKILIAGVIPPGEIAVAIYLLYTTARDAIGMLDELAQAFYEVMESKNVSELQNASKKLAEVLVNGGMMIVITLLTEGVAKVGAKVSKRVAKLRDSNKALTEEAATKQAMKELSAEERKVLDQGKSAKKAADLTQKFKEFGGLCMLGSIKCKTKLPDHIVAEAGEFPKQFGLPMPSGPFTVQKSILAGVSRVTNKLKEIAKQNRKMWPHFDKALAKAEKKGLDWVYDSNGKAWEVHHIKPVFMGGGNDPANLVPLPKAVHQEYTNWWNAVHRAFEKRFSPEEWDLIYMNQKVVPGSKVPLNPK